MSEIPVVLTGPPPVWADTVQEICETLPYFRSYQSGLYAKNGIAISILLNGAPIVREKFNWDVIVTHGGGCMVPMKNQHTELGYEYKLKRSQENANIEISPLIKSYLAEKPIVVILGERVHPDYIKIDHPYSVLGWYHISHFWSEYETGVPTQGQQKFYVRKKFRLEHIPDQVYPKWWNLKSCPYHAHELFREVNCSIQKRRCKFCQQTSPIVYENGFICLNENCDYFWMISNEPGREDIFEHPPIHMNFISCFMFPGKSIIYQNKFDQPFSLIPPLTTRNIHTIGHLNIDIWRGVFCHNCGKLSSRECWFEWTCRNCQYRVEIKFKVIGLENILDPFERIYTGLRLESGLLFIDDESGIIQEEKILGDQVVVNYHLPNMGKITHFLSNVEQKKEAEEIFKSYQRRGSNIVPFKRYAFHCNKGGRRFLSNQFQFSSGELYDHALITDTVSLETSPKPILDSLAHIKRRIKFDAFNQVSSLLYMKNQRMDWHDDGEDVVEGSVASFSMGYKAQMWFRTKETKAKKMKKIVLKLVLSHGDILVMWNKNIQQDYEHCLKPEGFRIAATARSINIDKYKNKDILMKLETNGIACSVSEINFNDEKNIPIPKINGVQSSSISR